jgi:hypothetical protein
MIGKPPAVEAAARESGKIETNRSQGVWQIQMFFVATSVVSAKGLEIEEAGGKRNR